MKLGQLSEDSATTEELNITPLIDIVFILLIFFVVTTTFVQELGLDVERPTASTGAAQPGAVIRVAVSSRGEVTVDGRPTSPWRVEGEVRDRARELREPSVLLIADKAVHADKLVELTDAARRAGIEKVALAVEQSPGTAQEGAP